MGATKAPTVLLSTKGTSEKDGKPCYFVIRRLGKGGMDEVFLAADWRTTGHPLVAIKAVKGAAVSDFHAARFEREVSLLQRVMKAQKDAGVKVVVPYLDQGIGRQGSELIGINDRYMVLEYVDGSTLREILDGRAWQLESGQVVNGLYVPWEIFRAVAAHTLTALRLCHKQGIVHADVTPSNILVSRNRPDVPPCVRLCDFGISFDARVSVLGGADKVTEPGVMRVTPYYRTPEHIRTGTPTPQSDIYQLGEVLYEAATGVSFIPQAILDDAQAVAKFLTNPLPPERHPSRLVQGMEPDLEQFILAALAPDPEDRPTAIEMIGRLERLCRLMDMTQEEREEEAKVISVRDSVRFSQVTIVEDEKPAEAAAVEVPDPELENERKTYFDGNLKKGTRWAVLTAVAALLGTVTVFAMVASSKNKSIAEYLRGNGTASASTSAANASASPSSLAAGSAPRTTACAAPATSAPAIPNASAAASVLTPQIAPPPMASAAPVAPPLTPATPPEVPDAVSATYAEIMALPPGLPCPTELMNKAKAFEKQHPTAPQTFYNLAACYNRMGKYALAVQAMDRAQALKKSGGK